MSTSIVYAASGLSTIDAKSRLTIPSELRDSVLASSGENILCLQRHASLPCLIGFGRSERGQLRDDLDKQWAAAVERGEPFNREEAGLNASSLFETNFEPSGRFVIPPILKHLGRLKDRAFFFGVTSHFMLWDPEIFDISAPPAFMHVREEMHFHLGEAARRGK